MLLPDSCADFTPAEQSYSARAFTRLPSDSMKTNIDYFNISLGAYSKLPNYALFSSNHESPDAKVTEELVWQASKLLADSIHRRNLESCAGANRADFCPDRDCTDQIFTLRQKNNSLFGNFCLP